MPTTSFRACLIASLLLSVSSTYTFAACGGAASSAALSSFKDNPGAWLAANGKAADLGANVKALAAAAVNAKDPHFGKALNVMLGRASADQGTTIGTALAALGSTCSDPRDPNDTADKQYISSHIAPNLLANANANTAYSEANNSENGSDGMGEGEGAGLSGEESSSEGVGGGGGVGGETGATGFANGGFNSGGLINAPTGGIITSGSQLTTFGASGASVVSPH